MSKHTPGPWHVSTSIQYGAHHVAVVAGDRAIALTGFAATLMRQA